MGIKCCQCPQSAHGAYRCKACADRYNRKRREQRERWRAVELCGVCGNLVSRNPYTGKPFRDCRECQRRSRDYYYTKKEKTDG